MAAVSLFSNGAKTRNPCLRLGLGCGFRRKLELGAPAMPMANSRSRSSEFKTVSASANVTVNAVPVTARPQFLFDVSLLDGDANCDCLLIHLSSDASFELVRNEALCSTPTIPGRD